MQSVVGKKQRRAQTANWLSWIKLLKQLTWVMQGQRQMGSIPESQVTPSKVTGAQGIVNVTTAC